MALEKPKPDSREWWQEVAQGLAIKLFEANRKLEAAALAPAVVPSVDQLDLDYVHTLGRAKAIVRESALWKRFIDGTPLENDLAVWMTDFAFQFLRDVVASGAVIPAAPPVVAPVAAKPGNYPGVVMPEYRGAPVAAPVQEQDKEPRVSALKNAKTYQFDLRPASPSLPLTGGETFTVEATTVPWTMASAGGTTPTGNLSTQGIGPFSQPLTGGRAAGLEGGVEAQQEAQRKAAFGAGERAWMDGLPLIGNPFGDRSLSIESEAWKNGWLSRHWNDMRGR